MDIKKLNDEVEVSGQISPADVPALAARGIRALICNRPDGEAAGQPAARDLEQAAAAHGLAFRSIPFTSGAQTPADVEAFARALDELPKPVLAYCRSGLRSASIWAMAEAGRRPVDELIAAAAGAGYDLSRLRPVLQALASR